MPPAPLAASDFARALLVAGALGVACAVLSVIVVLRRWAFIGEGISHAGFGGIGTAWLLSLAFPALGSGGAVYAVAVLFCVAVALSIGYLSRADLPGGEIEPDAAIGIFLVASLAWGFLALAVYKRHRPGGGAGDWEQYLFGDVAAVSPATLAAGLSVSAAVLVTVAALGKEILYYAYDPLMARVSGVRCRFVHYLLMVLLAMVIVIGMRVAGNVLVTALLVLPGATALTLSRRLGVVLAASVVVGLVGALGGLLVSHELWRDLPAGPAIVLVLFAEFVLAYAGTRAAGRRGE